MRASPLNAEYDRTGVPIAEYYGAASAESFGESPVLDPWPASQCLLYDRSWRVALAVTGADARKWMNGMVSANVRDLAPSTFVSAFQLDPKGHTLATLDVYCSAPDAFLLFTDESQREGLLQRLRRFIFIEKLTLADSSGDLAALLLRGPSAPAIWGSFAAAASPQAAVLHSSLAGVPQVEIWSAPNEIRTLWLRLRTRATPAGTVTAERDRIFSRVPRFGVDLDANCLPQETAQLDRISFTKGCYIGQEIVERIRARGAVHRRWSAMMFDRSVSTGAPILTDTAAVDAPPVGIITSTAASFDGRCFALGYLRRPHDAPGASIAAAGVPGIVLDDLADRVAALEPAGKGAL